MVCLGLYLRFVAPRQGNRGWGHTRNGFNSRSLAGKRKKRELPRAEAGVPSRFPGLWRDAVAFIDELEEVVFDLRRAQSIGWTRCPIYTAQEEAGHPTLICYGKWHLYLSKAMLPAFFTAHVATKKREKGTYMLHIPDFQVSLFYWHSCCIHLCKLPACLSMLAA